MAAIVSPNGWPIEKSTAKIANVKLQTTNYKKLVLISFNFSTAPILQHQWFAYFRMFIGQIKGYGFRKFCLEPILQL